jgi:signal peptidase
MRIIRLIGHLAFWIAAALGLLAGLVWGGAQLGVVRPLIVISGSMEPSIGTGDLLIVRSTPTSDLEVGDVVTLHSETTQELVTHRITEIDRTDDGRWRIGMKGDANEGADLEIYTVGDTTWTPVVRVPHGGDVAARLMDPAVSLPILLGLLGLLGLSLIDERGRARAGAARAAEVRSASAPGGSEGDEAADTHDEPDRTFLAELDIELAVLGVDMAAIDRSDQASGSWSRPR